MDKYLEATPSEDYERIAAAIRYLEAHAAEQPALDDLAAHLHLSPYHLQRLFTRWAGVSPKRFLQFLTVHHARQLLDEAHSLLDTSLAVGLSSPSRLHDLFVAVEGMTPAEYRARGAGLAIRYGLHDTPFGRALLAETERGVCALSFIDEKEGGADEARAALARAWPGADLREDPAGIQPTADRIFAATGERPGRPLTLVLKGTNFQLKVWEALLRIPFGGAATYGDIAGWLGRPGGSQAVGQAVGRNRIAFLIPCHRVIRSTGLIGDYRWGSTRKKALLAWESGRAGEAGG